MTYHTKYNYICENCGLAYLPFNNHLGCPRCNTKGQESFEIVKEAIKAYNYHKMIYKSPLPPKYAFLSLGDRYIYLACKMLAEYPGRDDEEYIDAFIKTNWDKIDDIDVLSEHYKAFLMQVLEEFKRIGKQ